MKVINLLDNELMRTGTEPNMGKQEGNTGRRQNLSPVGCDSRIKRRVLGQDNRALIGSRLHSSQIATCRVSGEVCV